MIRQIGSALIVAFMAISAVGAGGEIYGSLETTDGTTLVGPMRWGRSDGYWDDPLNALKLPPASDEEKGFALSLFGMEFLRVGGDDRPTRGLSVPFGHLRSIERGDDGDALLVLRNGEQVRVEAHGSEANLGHNMRGLAIEDRERGRVDLSWARFKRVEFLQGPGPGRDAERLHGTVETTDGARFTGFVDWDRDESMLEDVLDGSQDGVEHEVPFRNIREIQPNLEADASRILLADGDRLELSGTNDVNDDNRGIVVAVGDLGRVELEWRHVKRVTFSEAPPSPRFTTFDGGRRLSGTVRLADGRALTGAIEWDRDEIYDWESLDGEDGPISYSLPFSAIASVTRRDAGSSAVRLRDDRVLTLSGVNDVNDENRGLVVTAGDGQRHEVSWSEVRMVEFR